MSRPVSGASRLRTGTASYKSSPSAAVSQRLNQQRSFAAQKRLERLQLGGVAQSNDRLISSRPGSAGTPGRSGTPKSAWDDAGRASTSGGGGGGSMAGIAGVFSNSGSVGGAFVPQPPLVAFSNARLGTSSMDEAPYYERVAPAVDAAGPGALRDSSDAERQLAARGLSAVYDPTGGKLLNVHPVRSGGGGSGGGAIAGGSGSGKVEPVKVKITDVMAFLTQPGPRQGPVQCFITREKDSIVGMKNHRYQMFLEDGRRFLLAARRRKGNAASNYDITMSQTAGAGARYAPGFVGKLRANFVGTEFVLVDNGAKPDGGSSGGGGGGTAGGSGSGGAAGGASRKELAAVTYETNILGTKGPRKMLAALRAVQEASTGRLASQQSAAAGSGVPLLDRLKAECARDEQGAVAAAGRPAPPPAPLVVLRNKAPRWNEGMRAFCLNFGGRVSVASVKNFQLAADGDPDTVVLQFGKAGGDTFTCDFRWPLTPLQAFAICLSSFDSKLACE